MIDKPIYNPKYAPNYDWSDPESTKVKNYVSKLLDPKKIDIFRACIAQATITNSWIRFEFSTVAGDKIYHYESRIKPCCNAGLICHVMQRKQPELIIGHKAG